MPSHRLTIFAAPRPFEGEFERIQLNALHSWASLDPRPQIILFGAGPKTADECEYFGISLVPEIATTETGAPLLDALFAHAQSLAVGDLLAYINPDVIVLQDLVDAIDAARSHFDDFILIGAPWNVRSDVRLGGSPERWSEALLTSKAAGTPPARGSGADLFVFPKGAFDPVPPLAIGRLAWDNWLLWRAIANTLPALDVTEAVTLIHQDHASSTHRGSVDGTHQVFEEEVRRNLSQLRWWEKIARRSEIPFALSRDGELRRKCGFGRLGALARVTGRHARLTATPILKRAGVMPPLLALHKRWRKWREFEAR